MRVIRSILLAGVAFQASPVLAADLLQFGPPPAWVVPQVVPTASAKAADRPVALLLHDQQVRFEPKAIVNYSEVAFKIQKPEGLAAGSLSVAWDPATDFLTVNKLEIRRAGQVIDVLKSGQSFTTMRRESNLDLAMLDGRLTANIQPEGLQEGDVVVLATTTEHVDPVLKGHVEAIFAPWGDAQIRLAHTRLLWPSNVELKVQKTGDIPAPLQQPTRGGFKVYELTMRDTDPVIAPKGAPVRFNIGRMGEATDFRSWSDAAMLFVPLYVEAAVVPASGPLRDEVETIRKTSSDPKARAELALQMVQERVRYVALLMGQGGLVPALAATTWSRRFGDCKAKTALLLAILHELGIAAEPVVVNPALGDAIGERLPMLGMFNHVLVRAHIGGKDYWLDGTRNGDTNLADIDIPDFGWALPIVANAKLVQLAPPPRQLPDLARRVDIDASGGVYAQAAISLTETYRGDGAVELNNLYSAASTSQRDDALRKEANDYFNGFVVGSSTLRFDKAKREYTILIKGAAKLNWRDGWFYVPTSSVAFNPNFDRPPGPLHDVPVAVNHPRFIRDVAIIKLPSGFAAQQKLDPAVHETLAGVEYARSESVSGDSVTVELSERSVVSEVPYKDATAAAARLKALNDDDVYLRLVGGYSATKADFQALAEQSLASASDLIRRGNLYIDNGKMDDAIADFTKALSLDPKNALALGDRAIAYVWSRKFELAANDIDEALAIELDNGVAFRARGLMEEIKGNCAAAVEAYSKSLRKEPDSNFAVGHRAACEKDVGRYTDALADAEEALDHNPRWAQLHLLRAEIFARQGQPKAAEEEAHEYVRQNPNVTAPAWIAVGDTFARAGTSDLALAAYDKALGLKPEASLYVRKAQIRPLSDFAGRMADLDAALKLEPLDSGALAAKAELLAMHGDVQDALAVYERGMRAIPGQSPLSLSRAILLYKMGRKAEAERSISAYRKGALTATELNNLCWEKATAGILLESAVQDCRDALKLSPEHGAYLDSLGMALLKLGKLDEALSAYDKAIAKRTGAESLMGRAIVHARRGDRAQATADADAAKRLDPQIGAVFQQYELKL